MDEEIYENPYLFYPWRWERLGAAVNNNSFTPFGGGQRLCPGLELSRLEISIFLHHLVTTYKWVIVYFPTVKMKKKLPLKVTPYATAVVLPIHETQLQCHAKNGPKACENPSENPIARGGQTGKSNNKSCDSEIQNSDGRESCGEPYAISEIGLIDDLIIFEVVQDPLHSPFNPVDVTVKATNVEITRPSARQLNNGIPSSQEVRGKTIKNIEMPSEGEYLKDSSSINLPSQIFSSGCPGGRILSEAETILEVSRILGVNFDAPDDVVLSHLQEVEEVEMQRNLNSG
ncbi:hypothetical protein F3Y22_tig00117012pilonHSYRG00177 [Hibiscus syriacus]|uniref:Uncharacterized protein n=1 Tax=Hibiscus syriacus TaxID=106335 RepID=A0A6A2XHX4_HIBSY|nr:hypothetical protein F3Y22_tig00117012pilonHSYRG00177 [Hibiscus syriacus]